MCAWAYLTAAMILLNGEVRPAKEPSDASRRDVVAARLADVDQDYFYQGEYLGNVRAVCGTVVPFGLQVVALGNGQFSAIGFQDGLPGNGWDRETTITWSGARQAGILRFEGPRGTILIQATEGTIIDSSGAEVGQVRKMRRISSTIGAAPPPGAVSLFDGRSTEAWDPGAITADGFLSVGALTRLNVQDFQLHLEFMTPYMPYAREQGRANSGVYIQRRYEVQILDSFGLEPVFNGCGALYRQQPPDLNMSFPPLNWQTYDIYFSAARWDAEDNKVADARITVFQNGVAIHSGRAIPTKTGAGQAESPTEAPILLQDHGNPVQYRNVWIVIPPEPDLAIGESRKETGAHAAELTEQTCTTPCTCTAERHGPLCGDGPRSGPTTGGWILWKGRYPLP